MKSINQNKAISIDLALLGLRLVFGLSMALAHGLGKFLKLLSGDFAFKEVFGLPSVLILTIAVLAEFFGSLLLVFGVAFRWALLPLIATMAVAVFDVHISDTYSNMEKALLYLCVYLALFLSGPGKYSLGNLKK